MSDQEEVEPASTLDDVAPEADAATSNEDGAPEDAVARHPSWLDPLPALSLSKATAQEQAELQACFDEHGVLRPDASAADLLAGAECARKLVLPGPEIRLYKQLLTHHPQAEEAAVAMREMGARYEQIDVRPEAIRAYRTYLKHYPLHDDARALGQRAACLAWSLGDDAQVSELISELQRSYGRRGFVAPTTEELGELCAAVTTESR